MDDKEGYSSTRLSLFDIQPTVRDLGCFGDISLSWAMHQVPLSQSAIQDHLEKSRSNGFPDILTTYQTISTPEKEAIQLQLKCSTGCTLVSVKRTYTDIVYRGISFNHLPVLQFVLSGDIDGGIHGSLPSLLRGPLSPLPLPTAFPPPPPPPFPRRDFTGHDENTIRSAPMFTKVHRKHLDPEIADEYDLSWKWDKEDPNYLVIDGCLNDQEEDRMFEDTRKLHVKREKEKEKEEAERRQKQSESKSVITLKDHLRRSFVLPLQLCDTMDGLHQLIIDAFSHDDRLHAQVVARQYDLVNLKGEIILPRAWRYIVEPGMEILMRMHHDIPEEVEKAVSADKEVDRKDSIISNGSIGGHDDEPVIVSVIEEEE